MVQGHSAADPSQRAVPFVDARIEFDLRTAIPSGGPPKTQPRWLAAAYSSFVNRENTNYQIQIGVVFRYEHCPELRKTDALDLIAGAWLACKPLVDLARLSAQDRNDTRWQSRNDTRRRRTRRAQHGITATRWAWVAGVKGHMARAYCVAWLAGPDNRPFKPLSARRRSSGRRRPRGQSYARSPPGSAPARGGT